MQLSFSTKIGDSEVAQGHLRSSEAEVKFDILRPGEVIWVPYIHIWGLRSLEAAHDYYIYYLRIFQINWAHILSEELKLK